MNYIILNGVRSTTINGLMIQSLPPISKPLIRTQTEEIDGRDGDIITKLGYSAYDKQLTIGLYGNFDINAVIAFFNSEGTVTFSNEIDKYYNYQIIDQIDFEKLIKFRTATVTMHCQPFKYSAIEETRTFDIDEFTITNSGNIAAKPTITIYGSGNITLTLNGSQIFAITLGEDDYITIDAAAMNAYQGDTLRNRSVTGNYERLALQVGENTISLGGSVETVEITNYSRWI